MTGYIPSVTQVFQLIVECSPPTPLGRKHGGTALMIPITGGVVSGPRLTGAVLPGGADWAVIQDDGWVKVDANYAVKAEDGTIIQVFNQGSNRMVRGGDGAPSVMLTTPRFVAPEGPHEWLNHGVFVGTLTQDASGQPSPVHINVFQLG